MTRVGPNQDINDPTDLENLRQNIETIAVLANDHNNANNGITESKYINPITHPDNTRIIPISTLLKKVDGSEVEITGFTTSGTYKPENLDLYTESLINTHVYQPERFRDYYNTIATIMQSWLNRDNGSPITTTFESSGVIESDIANDHRGWAESNMRIQQKDGYATINQSQIPTSVDWIGNGPANYGSGTYPQLNSVINNLGTIMGVSIQPYLDVADVLNQGYYTGADSVDGFFTAKDLFERVDWNDSSQKSVQASNVLVGQSSLNSPLLIGSTYLMYIPMLVSNFLEIQQNISYAMKVTITPRNTSNRIFQDFHTGFVNKRIMLVGHHSIESDSAFIQHDGSNTSQVNDMLTSSFDLQLNDYTLVPAGSIKIVAVRIGFIAQLNIGNGSFSDWDTEDLLSDINVQFNSDDHSVNQDFDPSICRDMWNNPPPP